MVRATYWIEFRGAAVILEGIVTTLNEDGSTNVSPMGPAVDEALTHFQLRPFTTSTTFRNLKRTGQCIFHITDDAELLARSAIGRLDRPPPLMSATCVEGNILADACSWYALRVNTIDDRQQRATMDCRVAGQGQLRAFVGWNRAQHAVVEAAILATRIHLLPRAEIRQQFAQLQVLVDKTAGPRERRAFQLLQTYVAEYDG